MVPADNLNIKGKTTANVSTSDINFMAKLENIKKTILRVVGTFPGSTAAYFLQWLINSQFDA